MTSFTFNIEGVAGFFQEFGHEGSSTTQYSLLDVTRRLLVQASKTTFASSFGIHFIAVLYVSFAFLVPCLQFCGLIVIWVVPMTLSRMKRLFFVVEVSQDGCSADSYHSSPTRNCFYQTHIFHNHSRSLVVGVRQRSLLLRQLWL